MLGRAGKLPPKAPTPLLKRRPLAERSNLPASALLPPAASAASSKKPSVKKPAPQPPKRPSSWASEKSDYSERSDLEAVESEKNPDNSVRSRKERFLFWKNPNKSKQIFWQSILLGPKLMSARTQQQFNSSNRRV